jgi:starch-binding outer membrane protein, SusD/RagB family
MTRTRSVGVLALLLGGAAGCSDLIIPNENNPGVDRALATAGDVENLVAGGYRVLWLGEHHVAGPSHIFSTQSFQHSSTAANFGMLQYSGIPRSPVINSTTHADYGNIAVAWSQAYSAIAAVSLGLRAVAEKPDLATGLGADRLARLRVFGRFIQGLAHADLALVYDRAYVVDERTVVVDSAGSPVLLGEPVPYGQVMAAALGYLQEAIDLAAATPGLVIPRSWVGTPADLTMAQLREIASSWKAIHRSSVARNPQERAAVRWDSVLIEVGNGIRSDYLKSADIVYNQWAGNNIAYIYAWSTTWQQVTPFIFGMADQSGAYQRWLQLPLGQRNAVFPGTSEPVLIVTPDARFPEGETLTEQANNWGSMVIVRRTGTPPNATENTAFQFTRADRGTWRWSHYAVGLLNPVQGHTTGPWPKLRYAGMRLLAAEAHFHRGELQAAADSINVTRVGVGMLDHATAAGSNASCVPRLPDGSCGGLFEMLKWEKRMQTWQTGPFASGWWFDARGWGDLYRGTPLQFPIPAAQLHVLGLGAPYTFGGVGGTMAAPTSTYNFPGE